MVKCLKSVVAGKRCLVGERIAEDRLGVGGINIRKSSLSLRETRQAILKIKVGRQVIPTHQVPMVIKVRKIGNKSLPFCSSITKSLIKNAGMS